MPLTGRLAVTGKATGRARSLAAVVLRFVVVVAWIGLLCLPVGVHAAAVGAPLASSSRGDPPLGASLGSGSGSGVGYSLAGSSYSSSSSQASSSPVGGILIMVINGLLLVYAAVQTSRINDCLQFIAMNRTVPWWQGCPLSSATYAICVQPSFSERLVFMRGWAIALLAQNVLNYILAIVDMAAPGTVAAVVIAGILSFAGVVIFLIMFFSNKDAKKTYGLIEGFAGLLGQVMKEIRDKVGVKRLHAPVELVQSVIELAADVSAANVLEVAHQMYNVVDEARKKDGEQVDGDAPTQTNSAGEGPVGHVKNLWLRDSDSAVPPSLSIDSPMTSSPGDSTATPETPAAPPAWSALPQSSSQEPLLPKYEAPAGSQRAAGAAASSNNLHGSLAAAAAAVAAARSSTPSTGTEPTIPPSQPPPAPVPAAPPPQLRVGAPVPLAGLVPPAASQASPTPVPVGVPAPSAASGGSVEPPPAASLAEALDAVLLRYNLTSIDLHYLRVDEVDQVTTNIQERIALRKYLDAIGGGYRWD